MAINIDGVLINSPEQLEDHIKSMPDDAKQNFRDLFNKNYSKKEKDMIKYLKRSVAKDKIISEMASENMERVRAGLWSVPQLIGLTQDAELKNVLDDISTLSFELAATKLKYAVNPLLTADIKNTWIKKLSSHFYN